MKASVPRLTLIVSLVALFLCSPLQTHAQSDVAEFSGLVTDSSGAVIPHANVLIVNQDTGISRSVRSDREGRYTAPALQPGHYRITVEANGFETLIKEQVTLNVAQVENVSFQLEVGSKAQTVTVDGSGQEINTTDGSVSTVIDRQFVENLPLNGRSFQGLLYLAPGVAPNVASANSYLSEGQFVVNGQRGDTNYWMVDGVSGNVGMGPLPAAGASGGLGATNVLGGTNALVSVDALQEFRIETSTYAPEFGRELGGQISIQTRSGTNRLHGILFDYLRNGDLDATDWFADHNGLPKAQEIQNDFGGVLGGPIVKDKTFFFFSYEGLRLRLPQVFLGSVPDAESRTSAVPAIQPYLNMYPRPQPGAQEVQGYPGIVAYSATFAEPGSVDAFSLRLDHQLLKNLNLFARYSHSPSSLTQRAANENTANAFVLNKSITKTATVGATWIKSQRILDDLRFNYSVSGGSSFSGVDTFGGGTAFPGTNLFDPGAGLNFQNSTLNFTPIFGTSMREWYGSTGSSYQHQYNVVDTIAVQAGRHSLKFGVDYRRLLPTINLSIEGLYPLFDNVENLKAGGSYLTLVFTGTELAYKLKNLGSFAQDTFRVSDRLNLTYGVRWDVDFVPAATRGLGFSAVTGYSASDLSQLALAPTGTAPYGTRYGNLAPRIGGAYRLLTDPKWGVVLRGGFGVFYGLASTEMLNQSVNEGFYPFGSEKVASGCYSGPCVPFPTPPAVAALQPIEPPNQENQETLFGVDPHLNLPYALEWDVAVEQSLGKAQSWSLSYVAASDRRLLAAESITSPNPNYAAAYLVGNAGVSNYQGLQTRFQRQLTNGLEALLSYTWSHSIDTGSYGAYANGALASLNTNRGDSDFDVRQTFSGAVSYYAPAFNPNWITRAVTRGWSLHNIVQLHSGAPVDVADANPDFTGLSSSNSYLVIRPDVVAGQPQYLTGSQYPGGKALNGAAFKDPPVDATTQLPLRQGNLSRNALRSLGMSQWDFAAHRDFSLTETVRLQFRAELFNILNHPNFGAFNNQFQAGNMYFGQATEMLNQYLSGGGNTGTGLQSALYTPGGPRSGELALKLIF